MYAIKEHNRALFATLDRCRELNLTLNPEKCEFFVDEVKFYGKSLSNKVLGLNKIKLTRLSMHVIRIINQNSDGSLFFETLTKNVRQKTSTQCSTTQIR